MQGMKPIALKSLAIFALGIGWIYPVLHMAVDWSEMDGVVKACLACAIVALGLLLICWRALVPWRTMALLVPGVALNIVVGAIADALHLPVFLDTVGTICIGVWLGPIAGASAGVATSLIGAIGSPTYLAFVSIQAFVGMLAGVLAQMGCMRCAWRAGLTGMLVGLPTAILAAPLNALVFGDTSNGLSRLVSDDHRSGEALFQAVINNALLCEPIDKGISFLLAWGLLTALMQLRKEEPVAVPATGQMPSVATIY